MAARLSALRTGRCFTPQKHYRIVHTIYLGLRMVSSGMLRSVALVRTDVSEEPSFSFIRVTRIGELGTTQAVTSNRRTLWRNTKWGRKLEWNSELWTPLGWGGVTGEIVAWSINSPRQSEVPSFGRRVGGIVVSKLWMENCVTECPWSCPENFKEPIRGFHDLLRQKPPCLLIL
jgi:hypothetical protein